MIFDIHAQVFHYASSYLYTMRHPVLEHIFTSQFLSHGFSVEFSFQDLDNFTKINSIKCIIPLSKINSWFSTSYKVIDVSFALAATTPAITPIVSKIRTPEIKDEMK